MKFVEFWNLVKEAWRDPRKKAIIKLSVYMVFFLVVILMIKGSRSLPNLDESPKIDNNYRFTYTLNDNIIVNGNYDQDIIRYELETQVYYIYDNIYYKLVDNTLVNNVSPGLKIDKFLLNQLESYLSNSEELYKTEFKDGSIKKGYQMTVENFAFIYDNKEIIDKNYIDFSVTTSDNQVVEIMFNLTPYFRNYYNIQSDYNLKISFSDFNSADKLELNFSK
ncbi:MAG: hypothetical protein V8Q75_01020 [Bacilli bacterium]